MSPIDTRRCLGGLAFLFRSSNGFRVSGSASLSRVYRICRRGRPSFSVVMRVAIGGLLIVATATMPPKSFAGLCGQNVVVVVNADVEHSANVAEAFMRMHDIPQTHRVEVRGLPRSPRLELSVFKDSVLMPILRHLDEQQLSPSVSCVVYSTGFPTQVGIRPHTDRMTDHPLSKYQQPIASLTGMTYLYRFVLADDPNYLGMASNLYARGDFERHFQNPFLDPDDRATFDEIQKLSETDPLAAGGRMDELASRFATNAPLWLLAARHHADGDNPEAIEPRIRTAIQNGWRTAAYIRDLPSLAEHVDEALLSRLDDPLMLIQAPRPFSAQVGWGLNGWPIPIPSGGMPYMLSVMLGVVDPRGMTADEVIDGLKRSLSTRPTIDSEPRDESAAGQFWFSRTADVRTKTRQHQFPAAIAMIVERGFRTEIFKTAMPTLQGDVMGLMLGTPTMTLENRSWRFLPGAMAENLTSHSANFTTPSQTKITELLRAGAAVSCGPVWEPFTIEAKFPQAFTYGIYAQGATSIESMYCGIQNPFQTLVVGDPFAAPMARPLAASVRPELKGDRLFVRYVPRDGKENAVAIAGTEIYLDGKLRRVIVGSQSFDVRLPKKTNWRDRLRIVVLAADATLNKRVVDLSGLTSDVSEDPAK